MDKTGRYMLSQALPLTIVHLIISIEDGFQFIFVQYTVAVSLLSIANVISVLADASTNPTSFIIFCFTGNKQNTRRYHYATKTLKKYVARDECAELCPNAAYFHMTR
jgi:hypothetical protein